MELCIFTPAVFEAAPGEGAPVAVEEEGAFVAGQEEEPFVAVEKEGPSVTQKEERTPVAGEEEQRVRLEEGVERGGSVKSRGVSDLLRLRQPHVERAHPQGSVVAGAHPQGSVVAGAHPQGSVVAGADSQEEYATAGAHPQESAVGVAEAPIASASAASSHVPRSTRRVAASSTASQRGRTADSGRGDEREAGEGYNGVGETDEHGENNVAGQGDGGQGGGGQGDGGQGKDSVHGSGASGGQAGVSSSASGRGSSASGRGSSASGRGSSRSGAEGWSVVAPWECSEASIASQLKLRDPLKKGLPSIWALRLLRRLLQWYPGDRITAREALQHAYFRPETP
ncbi:unnamed protein product, partial [Closterium sp. NIES-54]